MQLIDEIEISYFRSFYKFKLKDLRDLNIIYGKNDSGKSNVVRALNLFFSQRTDHNQNFEFVVDFCQQRLLESQDSEDVRKFLYVKVTFNTPQSYQPSLGQKFYVKRQWTVSRGLEYHEEISSTVPKNRRQFVSRLINKVKIIYIPAIKDVRIFEMLLAGIHETVANSGSFMEAVGDFSSQLRDATREMFKGLPKEVSASTKIGAPTQLSELFKTLDFETISDGEASPKSLTRQRGDGIKVRHIPELLNFISNEDKFDYHIWGFEEPENSLDFASAQAEAKRLLTLAQASGVQMFVTTHSPSFYLLESDSVAKFYVRKGSGGLSKVTQGRDLQNLDAETALEEGFYLPAVAERVKNLAAFEARAKDAEARVQELLGELSSITRPVVLTEGNTDAIILKTAWEKLRGGEPSFLIRSCETGSENKGGSNGGASSLATRLKGIATDHPYPVIGLFDYDAEGLKEFKLNRNFKEVVVKDRKVKISASDKAFALCLPAPDFRRECEEHHNLPIEFLFRDEHLAKVVLGKKLVLNRLKASTMLGGKKIERVLEDRTHFKTVGSGKNDFAKTVVPSLPPEAFDAFIAVFELIEATLSYAKERASN